MINFKMNNGNTIPALGYGVFQMTGDEVRQHLPEAIELGFRHIDTANAYFNEVAVGEVVKASDIARDEFFVTTKLFPQDYPYDKCRRAIDETLARLGMDYVDLLLFHQPYGEYIDGWKAMEEAVRAGKVRAIGLSNFNERKVRQILGVSTIKPSVLQVEINPRWNQHPLKEALAAENLVYEGWYPLGHGDKELLSLPVFTTLAKKYGKAASQVILRWHIQEGNVVFPKTLNPQHMAENIDLFDFKLTDKEMAEINALPQEPYYHVPDEAPAWVWGPNDYSKQR